MTSTTYEIQPFSNYDVQPFSLPPFPVDALPPTIRAAVEEAMLAVEAPAALIASSALAAASLATQTEFNVERDVGLDGPISLYFITIAESGERKSAVDRMFFRAAREFENTTELEAE